MLFKYVARTSQPRLTRQRSGAISHNIKERNLRVANQYTARGIDLTHLLAQLKCDQEVQATERSSSSSAAVESGERSSSEKEDVYPKVVPWTFYVGRRTRDSHTAPETRTYYIFLRHDEEAWTDPVVDESSPSGYRVLIADSRESHKLGSRVTNTYRDVLMDRPDLDTFDVSRLNEVVERTRIRTAQEISEDAKPDPFSTGRSSQFRLFGWKRNSFV